MASQLDIGRSVVSLYAGSRRLIADEGAAATEEYGNCPGPEPKAQNLWPWRCIGWPILETSAIMALRARRVVLAGYAYDEEKGLPYPENRLQLP